jgi:uncharacterized protein
MSIETKDSDAIEELSTGSPAPSEAPQPVGRRDRILSIDAIRGVAVLGILLMNILEFGLPLGAELDPAIAGGDSGPDFAAWLANHLLFEGKMRAIFSMLFGASAVLLTGRAERFGRGVEAADIYYRRTLWLIAFGLVHAYFIWEGDILFTYGLFGLALYPLRKLPAPALAAASVVILVLMTPICLMEARNVATIRAKALAAQAEARAGWPPTDAQREDLRAWEEKLKSLNRSPTEIAAEVDDHKGGYVRMFLRRVRVVPDTESTALYRFGFFDATGMMVLGMALMKWGVFSAERSRRTYLAMASAGYAAGGLINGITGYYYWKSGYDAFYLMIYYAVYQFGRLTVALGHVAVVVLVLKSGKLAWLTSRLVAVGQMALSNYVGTSVVCTLIFNGYGLGLFGALRRWELYLVVLVIWTAQLILSPIWLRHFRFGPLEWLWRSLTYARREPFRLGETGPPIPG